MTGELCREGTPRPRRTLATGPVVTLVLLVLTALRLTYLASGTLDLSPDEAHYWEWSRRLDLSYYSKGPLVAYLIRVLTAVFGTSAFGIRLGAVLLSLAGAWAVYRLGRETFGQTAPGAIAVIGLQLTPLVWAGSLLMTIDPPLLVLWTLTLLLVHRAMARDSGTAWLLAGLATGLGLLAKYSMLFVLPGLALYFWRAPGRRHWLRRPEPYVGAILALAVFTPVIVWNMRQGWISARHVASQGRAGGLTWRYLVELAASQLGVLTPLVALVLLWGAWYGVREGLIRGREPYRFLMAFAAPVLGFYGLVALQGKVQANWMAAAYPPLALVTAGALLEHRARLDPERRRLQTAWLAAAAGVALTVSALGHATDWLRLPPHLDPTRRLQGWRELGDAVAATRAGMPAPEQTFVASDRYQITSELAFYAAGHPPAYNLNLGRRLNQYDLWEGPNARIGWDAIYVQEGQAPLDPRVEEAFQRTDAPRVVEVRRAGRIVRSFAVYPAYGFRGIEAPTGPPRY